MANISKLTIGTDTYDIKDSEARNTGVYSSTETIIGKWIDNKNVYRKVIPFTTATGGNDAMIDLTSLNIDRIVKIDGTVGANNDTKPINFYFAGYEISTRYSGGYMYVYSSSAYGGLTAYLIIEYTKI